MILSIVDFLNARLKDEAEAAQKIPSGHPVEYLALVFKAHGMDRKPGDGDELLGVLWAAAHLADYARRWPQLNDFRERVLREVAAKRAIIEDHDDQHECASGRPYDFPYTGCNVLRFMAAVHSDHPDYRTEWAPDER